VELWELIAREQIRDTLARYTWSGDSLRAEELAAAFCEDGELAVRGSDPVRGRAPIAAFINGVGRRPPAPTASARRIVRHYVTNIRFVELEPQRALVASYFTVLTEIGLDHYGRYRDTFVPVGDEWLIRHRFVSTDWRAEASSMAPSPAKRSR
jgi:SnoaL-like domain